MKHIQEGYLQPNVSKVSLILTKRLILKERERLKVRKEIWRKRK